MRAFILFSIFTGTSSFALTCQQLPVVAEWSAKHHVTYHNKDIRSPSFSKKALEKALQFYDPHRLILLEEEAAAFIKEGQAQWNELLDKGNCKYFEKWLESDFSRAKLRFILNVSLVSKNEVSWIFSPEPITQYPSLSYNSFAKSEKENEARLALAAQHVAKHANPTVFKIFEKQGPTYLHYALMQQNLVSNKVPGIWLAKSILMAMDPYSTYLTPVEYDDMTDSLVGRSPDFDLSVLLTPKGFAVLEAPRDTAAGQAGIKTGDVITQINGTYVTEVSRAEAYRLFSRTSGKVQLLVTDMGQKEREVSFFPTNKVSRHEKVSLQRTSSYAKTPVSVLKIPAFHLGVSHAVAELLREWVKQRNSDEVLILDLRNNPGGSLDESVSVSELFLGKQPIVRIQAPGKDDEVLDGKKDAVYTGPLLTLVDQDTASAAEIVAGALKDHGRSELIGSQTTFGKGSVQSASFPRHRIAIGKKYLDVPGSIKLTQSKYLTPNGTWPGNGGIRTHRELRRQTTDTDISDRDWELEQAAAIAQEPQKTLRVLTVSETRPMEKAAR